MTGLWRGWRMPVWQAAVMAGVAMAIPALANVAGADVAGGNAAGANAAPAAGAMPVHPVLADPRVRVVEFSPDAVVPLVATLGYAVTIDFGEDEQVETVSIGDGTDWQVTPNRRGNLLFVKPMAARGATNMAVVTNLRVYHFALSARPRVGLDARGDRGLIFALRFNHPAPAMAVASDEGHPAVPTPPREANAAYSFDGSREALPMRVFDDGTATYFKFADSMELPAIAVLDAKGEASVVNVANRDGYVVVDRVAPGFLLRRGSVVTHVFNDNYHPDAAQQSQLPPHGKGHSRHERQVPHD